MINILKHKSKILALILVIILFFTLILINTQDIRKIMACFLLIYTAIVCIIIRKKDKVLSYKRQIILQMLALGAICILMYYLLGIYFSFYKNYVNFDVSRITTYILPLATIIIASEVLRYELIDKKDKISQIFVYVSMVLIDIIIYWYAYDISKLNDFLTILGLITFASISCNLLYNYITVRFGYKPVIVYRLITVLSLYIIPILPNVYTFLRATLRIIYPYIIYLFLEYAYGKHNEVANHVSKTKTIVSAVAVCIIAILITMLISCKFYVGIIAIGSGSMTGTIDKGDAIVFVKYTDQEIKEGDVIIFTKSSRTVVHRVVRIVEVNDEKRYYTKGDSNQTEDTGYIKDSDIIGISKFKIQYIGYPTIWIREAFS